MPTLGDTEKLAITESSLGSEDAGLGKIEFYEYNI